MEYDKFGCYLNKMICIFYVFLEFDVFNYNLDER